MACVTCHDPKTGGTGSISGVNLHQVAITGANPHTVGNLKPPTNAYATEIEDLFTPCPNGIPGICGGNFWNGRAEGNEFAVFPGGATKHIGDEIFYETDGTPLGGGVSSYADYFGATADQALNPMPPPNFVEQNIERKAVCEHVKASKYAELYERVWGVDIDCSDDVVTEKAEDVDEERAFDISFKRLMLAVCAWQASKDLNSWSSKRDKALQRELDGIDEDGTPGEFPLVGLTEQENFGHDLFYSTFINPDPGGAKITNCGFCHSDNPFSDTGAEPLQLYADDGYHNIGTPRNLEIPDTGVDPDLGLAGLTGDDQHEGFHKTPTLRNVDKRKGNGFIKAYAHNGWFKSLESIVHFYNTAATTFTIGPKLHNVTQCVDAEGNPEDVTEKEALARNCWPAPAKPNTAIPFLLGNLGLTPEEEAAIVAYLKTLTDEHTARAPKPYKP